MSTSSIKALVAPVSTESIPFPMSTNNLQPCHLAEDPDSVTDRHGWLTKTLTIGNGQCLFFSLFLWDKKGSFCWPVVSDSWHWFVAKENPYSP